VYSRDPEFYAFSRTLEIYSEGGNKNAVLILTTDSDYYRYLKHAAPEGEERPPAVGSRDVKRP
jgi:modulator of FtsH protease HflC